jgi:hypothetical protein
MREAIRRALWIVPTIFLVSILSFWATNRNAAPPLGEQGVPLLFNERPVHIATLSWKAALGAVGEGPEAERARGLLVRLGGAALPHLLPRFDSLSPPERRRLALALLPIARRMQIPEASRIEDGAKAETFWLDFWQDHFVDFRPTVTRRVVSRFADRATPLRREELLRLDTFALEELVAEMATTKDVAALRRLCAATAHIAEKPWTIPDGANLHEALDIVDTWRGWWARHHGKFTEPTSASRLFAPVWQTRYGLWIEQAVRTRLGHHPTGESVLAALERTGVSTLSLLFLGLVGGSILGLSLSTLVVTKERAVVTRTVGALTLCWLGIPTVTWIAWIQGLGLGGPRLQAALLVLASGTAVALLHGRGGPLAATRSRLTYVRRVAPRALRGIAANASTLLGVVFVVEYGLDLAGWGRETVRAIQRRDVPWLMAMVMVTAVVLGLVHVGVAIGQQLSRRFAMEADDS